MGGGHAGRFLPASPRADRHRGALRAARHGRYGDVELGRPRLPSTIGLIAAWAFQMGTITIMQGPPALATGGVDLSWLTGTVAAGASYLALHPLCGRAGDRCATMETIPEMESPHPIPAD